MGLYTIRELENLSGIKAHTIRIWEKRYGLISPQRTSTNIRTYHDNELKKLLNISILNRNGLKISKIARLSPDEISSRINEYALSVTSTDSQIENLTVAMIDLDEHKFDQILARAVIKYGFEEVVTRILYPFFLRIGLMWQIDKINIIQEHFISNLVRQKFFSAIDSLEMNYTSNKRFVFFLPEGEYHEISLLFLYYLAKKNGFRTIYFGQSLPINELIDASGNYQFQFLVTAVTSSFNRKEINELVSKLSEKFHDIKIFINGSSIPEMNLDLPSNVFLVTSPQFFIKEIEKYKY